MRKTYCLLFFLFLISVSFATTYGMQPWGSTNLQCNDYEFSLPSGYNFNEYAICKNGQVIGDVNHCSQAGGTCDTLRFYNAFNVWYIHNTNGNWYPNAPPTGCTNSSCSFYVCGNANGVDVCNATLPTTSICSPLTNFAQYPYSGCTTPQLLAFNSSIFNDRYKIGVGVNNPNTAYSWSCVLKVSGQGGSTTQSYTEIITANTTLDILYTVFPRQFTTANLKCDYITHQGSVENFADQTILVDTAIPYQITNLFYIPSRLYPYSTLNSINFKIRSQFDNTPYPSAVRLILSSDTNLTDLNCSGTTNITRDTPNMDLYTITSPIICDNPASIAFTLSAYDEGSLQQIGSYNFNVTWEEGSLVIDNVNLIKRISTGDLELWATVSEAYSKSAIPLGSNLICNYTIASYDTGISYSGGMEEYVTYEHLPNEYFHISQTDMKNQTVISPTGYNLSNKFNVFISCIADNYGNNTIGTDRWIGYRRLKTFKCLEFDTSSIMPILGLAYFSDKYNTNNLYISCTAIPDLDIDANTTIQEGVIVSQLASVFFAGDQYTSIPISTNINAGLYSSCKDLINGETTNSQNPPLLTITFNTALHERDQNCYTFNILEAGKISRDLAYFAMFSTGANLITNSTITPTTADITFDLTYLPQATITNTTLAFIQNKTNNIIENGDNIICITSINDPSGVVRSVQHQYYDIDNPSNSCNPPTVSWKAGNNSDTYASYLQMNKTSCPFFAVSNLTGHLVCKSIINQLGHGATEQVSNQVLFITPTNPNQNRNINPFAIFNTISGVADMFLNPLMGFLVSDPLKFLLIVFIFLAIIIFFIAYARFSEALRKMLSGGE